MLRMMESRRRALLSLLLALFATAAIVPMTACESEAENAVEDVGEAVDETIEEAADEIDDAL